ncbi:MAG: GAF domain-containing SpoIIE family protein phosphatase [Rhodothermales bacterium]
MPETDSTNAHARVDGSTEREFDDQLTALDFISNLLTQTSFDLQPLLDEVVRVTAETMHMKACTIRLLNKESGEMLLKASHGLSREYLFKGPVIAAKSIFRQLIERCCNDDDVVEVYDVAEDPRMQYAREAVHEGIHSLLAAPLVRDGSAIGALSVFTATPHVFSLDERRMFKTIANQASVAISLAQLYQEKLELQQIEHELEIAADIQRKLMPSQAPSIPGYDIGGAYRPCYEIGGDFYDFISLPENNVGIALGDVSGKGIPASLLMATVRTALRVQAENIFSMRDVIGKVNRAVYEDTRPDEFVTLFYGVLDAGANVFTYVNAGHNAAILLRGKQVIRLEPGGPPIGILPDLLAGQEVFNLKPGDVLAVFTDGYPDAEGPDGMPFGDDRIIASLNAHRDLPAEEMIKKLESRVKSFLSVSTDFSDDRSIVIVKALDRPSE